MIVGHYLHFGNDSNSIQIGNRFKVGIANGIAHGEFTHFFRGAYAENW